MPPGDDDRDRARTEIDDRGRSADDLVDERLRATIDAGLDRSQSGAPAGGEAIRDRFSANEIFQRIVASAEAEFEDSHAELLFSGIAAGFAITFSLLGYTVVTAAVGEEGAAAHLLGPILYPLGFVIIVIGHYQLYTENTLPPVALVLTRLSSVPALLRVWGLVILGNLVGVGVGAYVLANAAVFTADQAAVAELFAAEALAASWWGVFFKGVFAGWLVAGLVWLDHAARDTVARVVLSYAVFYTIPVTDLFHIITSMGDALFLFFRGGEALWPLAADFLLPVFLGNTLGGVVLVATLNYAHTGEHVSREDRDAQARLSVREWLLGAFAGRSHVRFEEEE